MKDNFCFKKTKGVANPVFQTRINLYLPCCKLETATAKQKIGIIQCKSVRHFNSKLVVEVYNPDCMLAQADIVRIQDFNKPSNML